MKRIIQDILNLETGEYLKADKLLNTSEKDIFLKRRELEIKIQEKNPKIVCAICHQPLKLRAGLERIVHFAHLKDSQDCPIKTDTQYSKAEWLRIIYHGTKESQKHINMKSRLNEIMELDNRFSNIKIEKIIKGIKNKTKWKKPDIQCVYKDKIIVFEMQISHTFLSEIVARDLFYSINEIPLFWICDEFYPDFDYLKVFHCDILYHHNCNLIVFDDSAYKYSIKNKCLTFKIYWLHSYIRNNKILSNWQHKLVDISEIKFDNDKKRLFYYDYEKNEQIIKENISRIGKIEEYQLKKEKVFDTIRKLDDEDSMNSRNKCMDLFKKEINDMGEFNLQKWNEREDVYNLFFIFTIFLSIKENKYYGYKVNNIIQLLNIFNTKTSLRDYYWLLLMFIDNGNYMGLIKKEEKYTTFLRQKENYLNNNPKKSNKYTEYLHWFFNEIK